jgi:hypothetical protein
MSETIKNPQLATITENLLTLANVLRNDGKYLVASALYRRAIAFLEGIEPSETRHTLLVKILDDQSSLARRMTCGHPAW